jgi:hypothetical protein
MSRLLLIAMLAVFSTSCGVTVTEVVIAVDGDLATPLEVDAVEVSVTAPDMHIETATATFDAASPGFPRTLGIVQSEFLDEEYSVETVARKNGLVVVRRKSRFRFTEGQRRVLRVTLLRECRGIVCTGDTTCGRGPFCERPVQSTIPFDEDDIAAGFDAGM